jgi:tRNA 5-methylaminomethyl-2-thiouridine biosynthesis bifunctional protein
VKTYDIFIIGAGINGAALAYELSQRGQKVLVFEQEDIASGGSGAAGAFINPKISKSGPLKELIEKAYRYSIDFYTHKFPQLTTAAPLLHISKSEEENEKVDYFKEHTSLKISMPPKERTALLTPYAASFSSVFLEESAVVDAKEVCRAMLEGVEYRRMKVEKPLYHDGMWQIAEAKAKKMVLCTGAFEEIFKEPYIKLRRIFGQRCEIKSSTFMPYTIHHAVSVSATKKSGSISVGASHYLSEADLPSAQEGAQELLRLARLSVRLDAVQITQTYSGMRSGSNDYLPILGPLIPSEGALCKSCYSECYMINGAGGYGFVLAPYLADLMTKHLLDAQPLPEFLKPQRFYARWAKKEARNL